MLETVEKSYVIGEFAERPQGRAVPQERKSPPLESILPDRDRFLQISPHRHFRPEYVDLEWERLWTKTWLCVGRVSDVATKGAWFRYDIGRESFIIVRSDQDEIKALYNVCQHRGNRLVDDDFGRTSAFVCPYHSWKFDRAGRCTHVTDRELFKPGALAGSLDLPSVRVETFGGFVWITMNPEAPPLAEYLGEVADIVRGYPLDKMEVRGEVILELACNWKVILEAFSENYHVHITHASVMPVTEDKYSQMDFYPNGHTRRIVSIGDPARRRGEPGELHPMQKAMLEGVGIDPATFAGGPRDVRRALQVAKRAMNGAFGEAYAGLSDNQLTDDWATNIFPNMHWSMHAEGVLVLRYAPHRSDPNRCTLHVTTIAPPGVPFEFYIPHAEPIPELGRPARRRVRHDDPDVAGAIGQLLYEDIRNTRETQLGLQSRGFGNIRLSEHEQPIMYQYSEIERYLGDA